MYLNLITSSRVFVTVNLTATSDLKRALARPFPSQSHYLFQAAESMGTRGQYVSVMTHTMAPLPSLTSMDTADRHRHSYGGRESRLAKREFSLGHRV